MKYCDNKCCCDYEKDSKEHCLDDNTPIELCMFLKRYHRAIKAAEKRGYKRSYIETTRKCKENGQPQMFLVSITRQEFLCLPLATRRRILKQQTKEYKEGK